MKKILITILCAMFFTFGMVFSANALSIDANDYLIAEDNKPYEDLYLGVNGGLNWWYGYDPNQNAINAAIAPILGTSEELYKSDVSGESGIGSDSGMFADYYTTTFSYTTTNPSNALIEWLGVPFIANATHLLVKDGAATPAWYLFDITSFWDGQTDINLLNFWAKQEDGVLKGRISHVTLYGGGGVPVPEPGMVILLGIGLIGLAFFSRKRLLN